MSSQERIFGVFLDQMEWKRNSFSFVGLLNILKHHQQFQHFSNTRAGISSMEFLPEEGAGLFSAPGVSGE